MNEIIEVLNSDKKVLVITGAGISTLSGIPDFRGKGGLYTKGTNAEFMLSWACFHHNQDMFYDFYKNNMMLENFDCNIIHNTLAKLEEKGKITGIITQNIDNLHQRAGSKNVVDIHGNGDRYYCTCCQKEFTAEEYKNSNKCNHVEYEYDPEDPTKVIKEVKCDGIIRPDIVLYREGYDIEKHKKCLQMVNEAEVILVLGSSLTVSTVARFIIQFLSNNNRGKELYVVNNQRTPFDEDCKYGRCSEDLGVLFEKINEELIESKNLSLK